MWTSIRWHDSPLENRAKALDFFVACQKLLPFCSHKAILQNESCFFSFLKYFGWFVCIVHAFVQMTAGLNTTTEQDNQNAIAPLDWRTQICWLLISLFVVSVLFAVEKVFPYQKSLSVIYCTFLKRCKLQCSDRFTSAKPCMGCFSAINAYVIFKLEFLLCYNDKMGAGTLC